MTFKQFLEGTFVVNLINSLDKDAEVDIAAKETNDFLTKQFPGNEAALKQAMKNLVDLYFLKLMATNGK